jgi:CRP/FNR family cyclic AMP-dependent transcriptional regulator
MNQDLKARLAGHRFLRGLTQAQLAALADCARPWKAQAGAYLFREGNVADACYLLERGRTAIEINAPKRGAVPVQTIAAGDIVGWSWLIPPFVWQFDARALDAVEGIALDAPALRQKLAGDHELGFQLLQRLVGVVGSRLAATRFQLLDVFK